MTRGDSMYYDALKTFVVLADLKNFTKASEVLHISQPTVSLHIKNLEQEFQTKLFLRSPKQVQITPTGKMLYNRSKQILALYEQVKEEILLHHNAIQGELKIGASFTIGEYILPAILKEIQANYPELEMNVYIGNTEEVVKKVREFQVDIGLIEGQMDEQELTIHSFMKDELFIVCAPSYLNEKEVKTWKDLQNLTWITREEGSGTREYLMHIIRSNGLRTKSMITVSSNQGIKESLLQGMGISLLSKSVIEKELKHEELIVVRLGNELFTRTFSYILQPVLQSKSTIQVLLQLIKVLEH